MNHGRTFTALVLVLAIGWVMSGIAAQPQPPVPRFAMENMDRSVDPSTDFYRFAAGGWLKNNPVPADKSRWSGFEELAERNWHLLHEILDSAALSKAAANSPERKVGDFYISALDTNQLESLRFKPLDADLKRIAALKSTNDFRRRMSSLVNRNSSATS